MEIILNKTYGAFTIPHEWQKKLKCSKYDCTKEIRTDPNFVKYIKSGSYEAERRSKKKDDLEYFGVDLHVVEVPEEATDYKLVTYNGFERIYYVVNGKIFEV